jgi:hypothetical protein
MKLISILILLTWVLPGCATIAHKNVETHWAGYGVSIDYISTVAIEPNDIPAFIRAVDKLEKLLQGDVSCLTK